MKKNLIALLVIALVSVGLFAANPGPSTFDVTTTVAGINLMKITTAKFTGTTASDFDDATTYTGNDTDGKHHVTAAGAQTISAWISTLSNSRSGYKVTMSATAMKSEMTDLANAYINYTVTVNSQAITTTGATAAASKELFSTGAQGAVTPVSHQISLTVDPTTFNAAVQGEYTGTVTFTWTAT